MMGLINVHPFNTPIIPSNETATVKKSGLSDHLRHRHLSADLQLRHVVPDVLWRHWLVAKLLWLQMGTGDHPNSIISLKTNGETASFGVPLFFGNMHVVHSLCCGLVRKRTDVGANLKPKSWVTKPLPWVGFRGYLWMMKTSPWNYLYLMTPGADVLTFAWEKVFEDGVMGVEWVIFV